MFSTFLIAMRASPTSKFPFGRTLFVDLSVAADKSMEVLLV